MLPVSGAERQASEQAGLQVLPAWQKGSCGYAQYGGCQPDPNRARNVFLCSKIRSWRLEGAAQLEPCCHIESFRFTWHRFAGASAFCKEDDSVDGFPLDDPGFEINLVRMTLQKIHAEHTVV